MTEPREPTDQLGIGATDMTDKTQPAALAADHPEQPLDMVGRWYMVNKDGMATLCADREDAEKEAADAQSVWPHMGPHRAVQLVEASTAGFTAADMATASAQGFRDGVASLSANAGEPSGHIKEPYTLAEIKAKIAGNDYSAEMLLQHAMLLLDSASLAASPTHPAEQQAAPKAAPGEPFQHRVQPWLLQCFGAEIAADRMERNHRFLEESIELVQSLGCTASEAHQLVDYVFGRPVGDPPQEVGGVMVTLAALCLASGLDMHDAGEVELTRISAPEVVAKIRAKQAAKPKHSPLPQAALQPALAPLSDDVVKDAARYRWLRRWKGQEHEPPFTVQHEVDGILWGGDLDAAIDAARKQGGKP